MPGVDNANVTEIELWNLILYRDLRQKHKLAHNTSKYIFISN